MNPFDVRFLADRLLEASIEVKPSEWYTTDLHRGHIVLHGFDRISLAVFICFANMQIWKASHAVHALGYHLIFCPKYRHQVLEGAIQVELKRIFAQTCKTYGWELHSCFRYARPLPLVRAG